MTNLISGNDWNAGLGMSAVFGAIGGGISGFSAAKASGSGIWFGTEVKPSATVIAGNINNATAEARVEYDKSLKSQTEPTNMGNTATQNQVAEFAKEKNIFSAQKKLTGRDLVDKYLFEMNEGSYNNNQAGGFLWKDKIFITDGNHKINAAIQFKLNTGDGKYLNFIFNNGNFQEADPSLYINKVYKFPTYK